jgi:hypothetical protein
MEWHWHRGSGSCTKTHHVSKTHANTRETDIHELQEHNRTYKATVTQNATVDPSQSSMQNGIMTSTLAAVREAKQGTNFMAQSE